MCLGLFDAAALSPRLAPSGAWCVVRTRPGRTTRIVTSDILFLDLEHDKAAK